jgi:hypothetical protein
LYQNLVQVPQTARTADMVIRIDMVGEDFTVSPMEKKGIPIKADLSGIYLRVGVR